MVARVRVLQARVLPQGWLDLLRQLALFGAAYLAYRLVRGLVEGDATAAFQHARDLIRSSERCTCSWSPRSRRGRRAATLLMDVSSWLYVNAQTTVTVGALIYLYLRHNRSFYFVRNMLMIAMVIALVGYAVFPTAPPRFMPEWGFIDPVADFTGVHVDTAHGGGGMTTALTNLYAAVPSMHVAFALMIGWPLARLARRRGVAVLWLLYPLLIAFVIVATANHFILDALLGALTAGASAYGALWLARARPAAWRFSPARPEPRARVGEPDGRLDHPVGRTSTMRSARRRRSRPARPTRRGGPHAHAPRRRRAPLGAGAAARAGAQPPDRVAPDSQRDLADRPGAEHGGGGAGVGTASSSSAGSRSSSARSWTRSTGATRACPARAPRSGRSWTRRSTASRRGSC